jgi:hypothetical protein
MVPEIGDIRSRAVTITAGKLPLSSCKHILSGPRTLINPTNPEDVAETQPGPLVGATIFSRFHIEIHVA